MNQIKKNTVKAENQIKKKNCVSYMHAEGKGKRFLIVGNSITLHGIKEDIGWYGEWGMAASSAEKDYVHILTKELEKICPDAALCILHVSNWERNYRNGEKMLSEFVEARDFDADVILMRALENCPGEDLDEARFQEQYGKLVDFLNKSGKAKILLSTSFWHHRLDNALRAYAKEKAYPLVELGDLGELDEMKAIGLFEHSGVANHPGDKGMQAIADRIFDVLKQII